MPCRRSGRKACAAFRLIDRDLIRTGSTQAIIQELYEKQAPGIYFSSVVARELRTGAQSRAGKRHVETLVGPFEKVGRIVTPTHAHWKECGDVLARIRRLRPGLEGKVRGLVNDCLLALSARSIGATLYTRNREDFLLLRRVLQFSLVVAA